MEASSSSFVGLKPKYDVFLSFRGEDTRKNFVSHLYSALTKKGVHTFRDDRSLEKGKTIKDELFEAIEESQLSVIVLSKNYASSGWCLEELVKIIECKIHRKQIVIPILYGVDETVKCSIIDRFAEAFAKREEADSKDGYYVDQEERVKSWRKALTEAINESGWDISQGVQQYGNEAECIEQIVEEIVSKLKINKSWETKVMLTSCKEEAALASLFERPTLLAHLPNHYTNFFFIHFFNAP